MTTLADEFLMDIGKSQLIAKDPTFENQEGTQEEDDDVVMNNDLRNIEYGLVLNSKELQHLVDRVDVAYQEEMEYQKHHEKGNRVPLHDLIVEANEMCMVLIREIHKIHLHLLELYSHRFPELAQLVPLPLDYARTIQIIKNDTDNVPDLSKEIAEFLPQSTVISISMIASSTSGVVLSDEELEKVLKACDKMIEVEDIRVKIFTYVESQMQYYAPNLSQLVGPDVAANLIGVAGGLNNLAEMPAGNLKLIGKKDIVLDGFSSMHAAIHIGFVNECELVQSAPLSILKNVRRIVGNKASLAARADAYNRSPDGSKGKKFKEIIQDRIAKLLAPPPPRKVKSLPAPDDLVKQRRGGKRKRKQRLMTAQTELRKKMNRMNFAVIGEEIDISSQKDYGMLGQDGSGMIRLGVRDDKGYKLKHKKQKKQGGQSTVGPMSQQPQGGGVTSVYAMTPYHGLEMIDPSLREEEEKQDYFSTELGFNTQFKEPAKKKRRIE